MTRFGKVGTLLVSGALASVLVAACGGENPDPQVGKNPPPPPTTTATNTATPPPPPEMSTDDHRKAGKAAYDAGDYAKAASELEAVVAKEPNDVASQSMLGDTYAHQKNAAKSADAYFAATKADGGKDEQLALVAAKSLTDQKRYDDAIAVSQGALKNNDKSLPLWMYLGIAQCGKEDWAGAADTYGKLTKSFPDEPELWATLAVVEIAAGKKDDAKKTAKTALDKWIEVRSPKTTKEVKLGKGADEICMISRALRRSGDAAGALAALGKFPVRNDELSPEIDVEKGFSKEKLKDAKTAYATADKVIKATHDSSASAHLLLAAVALDQKSPDIAKSQLAAFDSMGGDPAYKYDRAEIDARMNAAASTIVPTTTTPKPKAK